MQEILENQEIIHGKDMTGTIFFFHKESKVGEKSRRRKVTVTDSPIS
jgi:hypothetical protein